jgi:hypothetical protein
MVAFLISKVPPGFQKKMQREIEFKLKVKLVIPEQALKFTKKILDMIQS